MVAGEPDLIPEARLENVLNKGYSIQDNLDIYDRFLEEEIYSNEEIEEKVEKHIREKG